MSVILKRSLIVAFLVIAAATGLYLNTAEATQAPDKLQQEYRDVQKKESLKKIAEREKYYSTMAAEMKALYKACSGTDKAACKVAREHEKATREKLTQARKANSDQFKAKMQEYRTKLGKDAPNNAEKDNNAMKAKKDDALE